MSTLPRLMKKLLMWDEDRQLRGDSFLPNWVLMLGILLLCGGIACLIGCCLSSGLGLAIAGLFLIAFGAAAVLGWKNQRIVCLNADEFVATTFLGHARQWRFDQIAGFKRNGDSCSLLMGPDREHIEGKIRIGSCAILSKRLIQIINGQFENDVL